MTINYSVSLHGSEHTNPMISFGDEMFIADPSTIKSLEICAGNDAEFLSQEEINLIGTFTNLHSLSLRINLENRDLSPFANLINLSRISISNAGIPDISFIRNMKDLESVNLSRNLIEDISALADSFNNAEIHLLNLANNRIKDISALSVFSNIDDLRLNNNDIEDISPLKNISYINRLDLGDNKISNISILKGCGFEKTLGVLRLINNNIEDIDYLMNFERLRVLNIAGNKVRDIEKVGHLPLTSFIACHNPIEDLSPIIGMYNLNILELSDIQFAEKDDPGTIVGNILASGKFKLESLSLAGDNLKDISFIIHKDNSSLTNLKRLNLEDNPISDIKSLRDMNLENLDIYNTNIEFNEDTQQVIASLKPSLIEIFIEENKVENIRKFFDDHQIHIVSKGYCNRCIDRYHLNDFQ